MSYISLRVTEDEKSLMKSYADLLGVNLSDAIKTVFFTKLEDEYDLKIIRKHETEKAKGNVKYYSLGEAKKELGFD